MTRRPNTNQTYNEKWKGEESGRKRGRHGLVSGTGGEWGQVGGRRAERMGPAAKGGKTAKRIKTKTRKKRTLRKERRDSSLGGKGTGESKPKAKSNPRIACPGI